MSSVWAADPPPCFFLHDAPPTAISTLSLHDALPISLVLVEQLLGAGARVRVHDPAALASARRHLGDRVTYAKSVRSEEHTSELQSRLHLVCRLLLEKNNTARRGPHTHVAPYLHSHHY